jgi:Fic family protein
VGTHYSIMYLEKRAVGKAVKHYLVHSYRVGNSVHKVRKYLGRNLTQTELIQAEERAERDIKQLLEKMNTEVFLFTLTDNQIRKLNRYNDLVKVAHLSGEEWRKFTEEFVYSTNAIEGSTVERGEVPGILKKRTTPNPEETETKDVAKAVNYLRTTKEDLSVSLIKKLHKLCFSGSKDFAGEIRTVEVVIKNSRGEIMHVGVPSSQLHMALADMISWYKRNKGKFRPLVLAAIIHNQFEYIHPFRDGNGRVGRLLLNFILLKNGYPPINISLDDRAEYYGSLQKYQKDGDLKPTARFLIKQYRKTLRKVTTKAKDGRKVGT